MMILNRRKLMIGSAAAAGLSLGAFPALALDLAELHKEPELGDMALGAALTDAKVTVVEYASATCPHCAKFHREVWPTFKKDYVDSTKVRFVFREFPLNDAALAAFMIARAAGKDAYFPLMDVFFTTLETWAQGNVAENLFNIAKQAGFTKEKFDATLRDEALAKKILAIKGDGEKFGVDGTPCFFVNGDKMGGAQTIEQLKEKIDPLLG
jgi:protein-disulfide isomerase